MCFIGYLYCFYVVFSTAISTTGYLYDGTSLGAAENIGYIGDMVAIGDDVHLVIQDSSNRLMYRKRSYGSGWSGWTNLATSLDGSPSITKKDSELFVFWYDSPTVYYRHHDGSSWGSAVNYLTDSPIYYGGIQTDYESYGNTISLVYPKGSSLPTTLRHVCLGDGTNPTWRNQGQSDNLIMEGETIQLYTEIMDSGVMGGLDWAWLATNETGTWQYRTDTEDSCLLSCPSGHTDYGNGTCKAELITVPKGDGYIKYDYHDTFHLYEISDRAEYGIDLRAGGEWYGTMRAFFEWDTTSIPKYSAIRKLFFVYHVPNFEGPADIRDMDVRPSTADEDSYEEMDDLYDECRRGYYYGG